MVAPARGEIWWVDFDPVTGREQAARGPALVVSADTFNQGPRGLVIVLPMTRTQRPYTFHVEVQPDDSGLDVTSYIMCEQIRSVSRERFLNATTAGRVRPNVLAEVEDRLRALLHLPQ